MFRFLKENWLGLLIGYGIVRGCLGVTGPEVQQAIQDGASKINVTVQKTIDDQNIKSKLENIQIKLGEATEQFERKVQEANERSQNKVALNKEPKPIKKNVDSDGIDWGED